MPFIVVINNEGKVLYKNIEVNPQELSRSIRCDGVLSDDLVPNSEFRIKGFIVLAEKAVKTIVPSLSPRQKSVLGLLAKANSPDQIALKLKLSEATIRTHIRALKKKLGAESRDQMMAMAGSMGLCDPFGEDIGENHQL